MAFGRKRERRRELFVAATDLSEGPRHRFLTRRSPRPGSTPSSGICAPRAAAGSAAHAANASNEGGEKCERGFAHVCQPRAGRRCGLQGPVKPAKARPPQCAAFDLGLLLGEALGRARPRNRAAILLLFRASAPPGPRVPARKTNPNLGVRTESAHAAVTHPNSPPTTPFLRGC